MYAKIQCLSLILTGMSILEHVNMSTYLVSLAPQSRISPSRTVTLDQDKFPEKRCGETRPLEKV